MKKFTSYIIIPTYLRACFTYSHKSHVTGRAGLRKCEALGLKQTQGPKILPKFDKECKKNQISFF